MRDLVRTDAAASAPLKDLAAWAKATEAEIDDIRATMRPLEERLASARERLDLIRRLMGLAEGQQRPADEEPRWQSGASADAGTSKPVGAGAAVEDHLAEVLGGRGEPMHISELREALIQRGVPLPGRGDEANIIVRLRRDETRFTRTGRGMYGLAQWGLPAAVPTTRKKVRPRKRVAR